MTFITYMLNHSGFIACEVYEIGQLRGRQKAQDFC